MATADVFVVVVVVVGGGGGGGGGGGRVWYFPLSTGEAEAVNGVVLPLSMCCSSK